MISRRIKVTIEISSRYTPEEIEPRWREHWAEKTTFHTEPRKGDQPFTIVIPPPNITGVLHMGHGLNNTLQDILVRRKRMQGFNTLWLPGTDHAGIATQNVVEKKLLEEHISRDDLSLEDFLDRIWKWKSEYGNIIIEQLQCLGVSCDWSRQRFTMDKGLSNAVNRAFKHLYEKGLIYRGNYMTNWCPRCETALSDDEVEHEEIESKLWYIQYPLKQGSAHITVATTRPETMLGDTAVAVHPEDSRYKRFIGEKLILPIADREIPVISDEEVDPEFGTGAVKVTPAHDPNDYEMGLRHNLDIIRVIDGTGKITDKGIHFADMHRFDCREAIVRELRDKGFLEKTEDYTHSVGHCYRCSTTLEPNLSRQWFVKMKPLAKLAINATLNNRVRFHPAKWKDYYLNWLENVRDWCISRQITWGHRIPAWTCRSCGEISVSTEPLTKCLTCESTDIAQDEDVLDTWFSSALWPFSTLGWPEQTKDLKFYYPTSVLVTDRGIIYFWVARMVMMGIFMLDEPPFSDVYIHGTILDEQGRKMSKSLGNGIDPLEMADTYGADAVRFALTYLTTEGQDIKLSPTQFEMGRNFMNKLWNGSRFTCMNFKGTEAEADKTEPSDERHFYEKWITSCLHTAIQDIDRALDNFKFSEYAGICYDFFWRDFCDWYLEIAKIRLEQGDPDTGNTLYTVLTAVLQLMHPAIPFITEELWQTVHEAAGADGNTGELAFSSWPEADTTLIEPDLHTEMNMIQDVVRSIRNIRANFNIPPSSDIKAILSFTDGSLLASFRRHHEVISRLCTTSSLDMDTGIKRPKNTAVDILKGIQIYVPLEGLINISEEKAKLEKKRKNKDEALAACKRKLENQNFLENAPEEVVDREWDRKKSLIEEIKQIKAFIDNLE